MFVPIVHWNRYDKFVFNKKKLVWMSTKTILSGDEVLKFKLSKKVFNELKLNANIKKVKNFKC